MVSLKFVLTPEAAARVHNVLVCISKFSESVSIEARKDRVSQATRNLRVIVMTRQVVNDSIKLL
jgi:cell cycle checkpoint control protein RAD9A